MQFSVPSACVTGFVFTDISDMLKCNISWLRGHENEASLELLFDFIDLTQVHNFTVSEQDIFTFRRLSVFTVSFTEILRVLMQIMKRFVASY